MEDKKFIQALYTHLSSTIDLGDLTQFETQLSTDDKFRRAIFNQASSDIDLGDFNTFEGQVKKKDISLDPLLSAAKGETILQELGQPSKEPITPKLPYQEKEQPKTTQEETLAEDFTVSSVLKAQQKLPEYLKGEQDKIEQESIQSIMDELSKLEDTYKKKAETNPEKSKALQKELEQKKKDVIALRSANIPIAIESLYKKGKDYKWLDPTDVKEISKLAREIASKPTDFIKKKDELESLRNDFMSKVGTLLPEEQAAISKELGDVIAQSSILDEKGVPSVFGWKQEVLTKKSNIERARDKMLADNPELANINTDYGVRSSKAGKEFMALARANDMFDKVLTLPDDSGSFIEGFKSQGRALLTAGMSDLFEAANITKILRKQAGGDELNDSEQAMVDAYGIYQTAQGAGDFGKAYTRGQGIAGSIAFMESFALTGGLAGVGEKTALKLLGNQVKNKVIQNIAKGIGSAVVRTPLLPMGATETVKRMGGSPKLNKEGQWKVDPATIEPTIQAIGKGLYSNFANALGETAGGWLAGTKVSSVVSKGLGINKIPKGVAKIFNAIGMQPLGELPEEYLTTLMETPVMGDQTLKEAFSGENVWETAVQVGLMTGFFSGLSLPSVVSENVQRARNKEMVDLFGKDKVVEIRDAIENKDKGAFARAIDGLGDVTNDQKRNLIKYANSLAQEKGATVAQEAAKVSEEELRLGKESFETKEELFKYLDENALDKETGVVKRGWLSQEEMELPNDATIKAISEWEDKLEPIKKEGAMTPEEQAKYNEEVKPKIEEKIKEGKALAGEEIQKDVQEKKAFTELEQNEYLNKRETVFDTELDLDADLELEKSSVREKGFKDFEVGKFPDKPVILYRGVKEPELQSLLGDYEQEKLDREYQTPEERSIAYDKQIKGGEFNSPIERKFGASYAGTKEESVKAAKAVRRGYKPTGEEFVFGGETSDKFVLTVDARGASFGVLRKTKFKGENKIDISEFDITRGINIKLPISRIIKIEKVNNDGSLTDVSEQYGRFIKDNYDNLKPAQGKEQTKLKEETQDAKGIRGEKRDRYRRSHIQHNGKQ